MRHYMQKLDEIDLITDEITALTKPAHSRKVGKKTIKVRSSVEVAKDNYKAAKRLQRANIKRARQNVRSYKLLIKQARNTFKLVKLNEQ